MKLPGTTKIAGHKTVDDWDNQKVVLNDFTNIIAWQTAFEEFFKTRLNDRYLNPINAIKDNGGYTGEGFSIMTIICSLIEFLEGTYQGKNYKFLKKGDPPLGIFEYSSSSSIFVSFLTNREPFMHQFDLATANEFYSNVRCGLLHEARTNGKWTIWGASGNKKLLEKKTSDYIIFRDEFYTALLEFINTHYKNELLASDNRKQAFIRKYDNLCYE